MQRYKFVSNPVTPEYAA
ncbi:unnamed protein product, partial [Allacma fusca]